MTYSSFSLKALLLSAVLAVPGLAFAAAPAMTKDGVLVDHNGMTLYTFAKDAEQGGTQRHIRHSARLLRPWFRPHRLGH